MGSGRHRRRRSWFWAWFPAALIALWLGIWGSLASGTPHAAFQRPLGAISQPQHIIHPRASQPAKSRTAVNELTVTRGETLWDLARKYCGNGNDYKHIMNGNGLKTWLITPGQKIKATCGG